MKEQERTEEKNWRKIAPCDAGACVETSEADGFVSVRSSQRPNEVARFSRDEWEAFVAGLRATESAERGEVDPAVARIAYNALASSCATHRTEIAQHAKWAHRWSCSCGERSVETDFGTASYEAHQHEDRMRTAAVLDALAGRLLPPVVQTREERGTRIGDGSIITLAEAGSRYTLSAQSLRVRIISTLADDGSPYGGATLTGKWRNVD